MKKSQKIVLIVISCIVVLATIAGVILGIVMNQPASVVTKFEEKRAKEIASFKEKKPGYIVDADKRAGDVQYTILFNIRTKESAKKFMKKYNLKLLFPNAEIKISDTGTIRLDFKRNEYTRAAHLILTKITKETPKVYLGYPTVYANSIIKYKPDISLHAENPTKLEYTNANENKEISLSVLDTSEEEILDVDRILATKADFDAYVDLFATSYMFEGFPEALQIIKDQYGEDFFESNALLVTKQITRAHRNDGLVVDNVYLSDNKIYVVIRSTQAEGILLPALLKRTFYLTVSKDAIKGATELITLD